MTEFESLRLQEKDRDYKDKFKTVTSIVNKERDQTQSLKVLEDCIRHIANWTPLEIIKQYGTLETAPDKKWTFTDKKGLALKGDTAQDAFYYFLYDEYQDYQHELNKVNKSLKEKADKEKEQEKEQEKELERELKKELEEPAEVLPSLITADLKDIIEEEIEDLKFYVNKILPEGFGFLAAPPKSYKSFLCLQICAAVANGRQVLGHNTIKSKCLYFDLESEHRRPKGRAIKMQIGNEIEKGMIKIVTKNELKAYQKLRGSRERLTLANGFAEVLDNYLAENPDIGLVIIDVWGRIRTEQKRTQQLYEHDYEDIEKLQDIAANKRVCILAVHHTTKSWNDDNPFYSMGGSIGTLGAADFAAMICTQKYDDSEAVLITTGRDSEEMKLSIKFDKEKLQWIYQGTAEEIASNKERQLFIDSPITQTITRMVELNGGRYEATATALINASAQLHTNIYEKSQQVGRFIQEKQPLFMDEYCIEVEYSFKNNKDRKKERKYIFSKKNIF